ncbi:MAG: hypothetical protein ABIK92_12675 [Pseudomonadota bacterium]
MADMLKYSFYALGMAELGIPPALPGEKWYYVKNPFLALRRAKSHMQTIKYQIENKHKVNIDLKTPSEAVEAMLRNNEFTK